MNSVYIWFLLQRINSSIGLWWSVCVSVNYKANVYQAMTIFGSGFVYLIREDKNNHFSPVIHAIAQLFSPENVFSYLFRSRYSLRTIKWNAINNPIMYVLTLHSTVQLYEISPFLHPDSKMCSASADFYNSRDASEKQQSMWKTIRSCRNRFLLPVCQTASPNRGSIPWICCSICVCARDYQDEKNLKKKKIDLHCIERCLSESINRISSTFVKNKSTFHFLVIRIYESKPSYISLSYCMDTTLY